MQLLNQVALGYILSAALNVALELGIADRLADGPRSSADLANDAGVTEDGLYRVLRALASARDIRGAAGPHVRAEPAGGMLKQGPASLLRPGTLDDRSVPLPRVRRNAALGHHRTTCSREGHRHAGVRVLRARAKAVGRVQQRDDVVERSDGRRRARRRTTSAAFACSWTSPAVTGTC